MSPIHNEYTEVERPFIEQLKRLDWAHIEGSTLDPEVTERESFNEVLLTKRLRSALRRINLNDAGDPWLDEGRISQAVSALERLGSQKLLEANQKATTLLLKGTTVEGVQGWDQGRSRTVHYIDWERPENNDFLVINQFRVDEPGGQARKFLTPDLVLFVNGIPLVVVECKSPATTDPMETAIDQLQRYANQRQSEENEGNESLFYTNQFVVATHFDKARVGTFTAEAAHFLEWKDTSPVPMSQVAASLGKERLSSQEILVAGMLRPTHLLDIVHHFLLFMQVGGRTIKAVCRYQQFRATHKAIHRLLTGKTKRKDGEHDRRGGIIWHTQGSGKSLTMVFLVRKMRTLPELRRFKLVLVTDRKDLQKQLSETAELTDETPQVAKTTAKAKELLSAPGPGIVFVMIQKYQKRERDLEGEGSSSKVTVEEFPILNEDEAILVMVDEAHRSQASALHANLLKALPNCARIGFTGTPIIMGAKKWTHEIFGEFIDRYTLKQSEDDHSTVPILYEGRTAPGIVKNGGTLDELFEDMFRSYTPVELEEIKRKYATKGDVLEASKLIAAKARDMLHHYVDNILPNGFKAQVATVSREATVRYYEAFLEARAELVRKLERLQPGALGADPERLAQLSDETQFLVRAHRHLDLLRKLEFAPVISPGINDKSRLKRWTESGQVEARIARFKKPLMYKDSERRDPLAFLIVKSMLLTGFDAPFEQVLYLDRPIKEHELLQAIARVNRTCGTKQVGLVVDYYGVARHLKEALAAYNPEDVEGALKSLKDEIPKLRDRHKRVVDLFKERGVKDLNDTEACIEILRDERLRAQFTVKLKQFLTTLDVVLPRPEGLPYLAAAKTLRFIHARARNRYRDEQLNIIGVGDKVRQLIDEYIISQGVDPKIPPISITDAKFSEHVTILPSDRAKASEMEHAVRYHIRRHMQEDPEYYQKLSDRLTEILREFEDRWAELVDALQKFVREVQAGRQRDETGLDPKRQAPFLGILKAEVEKKGEISPEKLTELCGITVEMVEHIQQEIQLVGFWQNPHAQTVLRKWVVRFLDDKNVIEFNRLGAVAGQIVELAKANHSKLVE